MKRIRTEESSREGKLSDIDHSLTCRICYELLRVPVKPRFECRDTCPIRCCLHCMREYFMINSPGPQRSRQQTGSMVKCLLCDMRIDVEEADEKDLLDVDHFLMHVLDACYPDRLMSCPYCADAFQTKSQSELFRHIQAQCPFSFVMCTWCGDPVRRLALGSHVNRCPKAEKCNWCAKRILTRSARSLHRMRCGLRKVRCLICDRNLALPEMADHLKTHTHDIEQATQLVI